MTTFGNNDMVTTFDNDIVLALLGGVWPNTRFTSGNNGTSVYDGFCFDAVGEWRLEGNMLVPYDGGLPMDGPNLKLIPVDDSGEEVVRGIGFGY